MVMSGGGARISDPLATPGFRFYTSTRRRRSCSRFYLRHRLAGTRQHDVARVIPVVDVYGYHPSKLAAMAGEASVGDKEQWFFFCPRAERELHGGRPARTTPSGYWKATGSPSFVFSAATARVIGVKRTMVFYQGRAPSGTKTRWKMNEYKVVADDDNQHTSSSSAAAAAAVQLPPMAPSPASSSSSACVRLRNELSVCRVYVSTGRSDPSTAAPLDAPPVSHHDHHQPQLQLQQQRLPSSAATNANLALASVVLAGGAQAEYECSHDSSGASSEDAVIDWNSLITATNTTTAGDFSFNDIDFSSGVVGPWAPQV